MAVTYDITTQLGQVRLIGQDTPLPDGTAFFSDDELTFMLNLQTTSYPGALPDYLVLKAAVQALRTKARNYASRSEKQIGDATYDYLAASKQLMATADALELEGLDDSDDDSIPAVGEAGGHYEYWW